ncbi:MAG: hemolysin III family protein [Oscillospiraceae bacterium]|nr:hemolysin III family protein [Oscillospiraceae bacterium]MDE7172390.1 hemolysin III family protein [Oscillospiraceae bacterium]
MEQVLYHDPFASLPRRRERPMEKGRNPYDGLRPWSAITHGVGAALSVLATAVLTAGAALHGADVWKLVSFAVYGLSMTALYTASTLYHCLNTSVAGRVALRKLDHASIYFLIAGSYTPVCLIALRGAWGWSLFGVIWALAVAGLVMCLTWINCPRALTSTVYIAMGWLAVIAIYPIWQVLGFRGVFWLLTGGVLYTVGGVLYALKWPGRDNPQFGCHEVFHVFIVLGSIAHFVMMHKVLLPL